MAIIYAAIAALGFGLRRTYLHIPTWLLAAAGMVCGQWSSSVICCRLAIPFTSFTGIAWHCPLEQECPVKIIAIPTGYAFAIFCTRISQ